MNTRIHNFFSILSLLILSIANKSEAAGGLDATFGANGKVTTDFASHNDQVNALAIQPDGKILAVGQALFIGIADFALVRYNGNGTLDASFGNSGKVATDFSSASDQAFAVALQPDGKIIAGGVARMGSRTLFGIARYNSNGMLDTTFGSGGKMTTTFSQFGGNEAFAMALQTDGKILLAGRALINNNFNFALARFNSDGTLDTTFDTDGKVTTAIGTSSGAAGIALQPDGKFVVVGFARIGASTDFALARYNADGSLDPNFGVNGTATTGFGTGNDYILAVALQPDGKLAVAGISRNSPGELDTFALARYTPNGVLDSSFGANGKVVTSIISQDANGATAIALQANGKIVVAGYTFLNAPIGATNRSDFALARYNPNGTLDISFGTSGGILTTDFGSDSDVAYALAIQSDGKIIAAGFARDNISNNFGLTRYIPGDSVITLDLIFRDGLQ